MAIVKRTFQKVITNARNNENTLKNMINNNKKIKQHLLPVQECSRIMSCRDLISKNSFYGYI